MKVVFRADAGDVIGHGHVMRCLTLADALRDRGARCRFVCRAHAGHLSARIQERGYAVSLLPADPDWQLHRNDYASWTGALWQDDARAVAAHPAAAADWLVVDHYALDARWHGALRAHVGRILVIDDLANRQHDADLLLDSGLTHTAAQYRALLPQQARCLCGPQYALLGAAFAAVRESTLLARKTRPVSELLVFLGGGNSGARIVGLLPQIARFLRRHGLHASLVLGSDKPSLHRHVSEAVHAEGIDATLYGLVSDMPARLAQADLAVGAAGGSAYERACLGLPSVVLQLADNQAAQLDALTSSGAALVLREGADLSALLDTLLQQRHTLGTRAAALCDGLGAARVADAMMNRDATT